MSALTSVYAGRVAVDAGPDASGASQHWGDSPTKRGPPSGVDATDAALPIAAFLDALSASAASQLTADDLLPFANVTRPLILPDDADEAGPSGRRAEKDPGARLGQSGSGSSFLQKSVDR